MPRAHAGHYFERILNGSQKCHFSSNIWLTSEPASWLRATTGHDSQLTSSTFEPLKKTNRPHFGQNVLKYNHRCFAARLIANRSGRVRSGRGAARAGHRVRLTKWNKTLEKHINHTCVFLRSHVTASVSSPKLKERSNRALSNNKNYIVRRMVHPREEFRKQLPHTQLCETR